MTHNQNRNNLYNSIKNLIEAAKLKVVRNVNTIMVLTYYEMGRIIVEVEQYGQYYLLRSGCSQIHRSYSASGDCQKACDVFDDKVNRFPEKVKSRKRALELIERDHNWFAFICHFFLKT